MVTITNREIYDKLCDLERHVLYTNGKVKLNRWISGIAFSVAMTGLIVTRFIL